jgi:putative ABC transport system permease protein
VIGRRLHRRTRGELRAEVDEEIRTHLELRAAALERRGYSPAAARAEAERLFGDRAAVAEHCLASDVRRLERVRRREWLSDIAQDVVLGARQLRRRPGFAALAVVTLAVAIGVNAAVYALADHVLVRPLPYDAPGEVVTILEVDERSPGDPLDVSPGNYLDWRDRARSFAALGLAEAFAVDVSRDGTQPEAVATWRVTDDYFAALGVRPLLGRTFEPGDHAPNAAPVAVISAAFWQSGFGGDPGVIGATVEMDGAQTTLIGVLPPSVEYPAPRAAWTPKHFTEAERADRRSAHMHAVARLAPGVTVERAQAELDVIAAQLAAQHAATNRGRRALLVPLDERVLGEARPPVLALVFGVAFLLLIACANLVSLLVARGLERSGELAVRGALGAGRWRLVRQLATESLLLSVVAGAFGAVLAWVGVGALVALAPPGLPRIAAVGLDGRVLLFLCAVTALASVLFGLLPALRLSRPDLMVTLRARSLRPREERLRRVLLTAQVALCVVLLVSAGLMARSFERLLATDLGFDAHGRATIQLFLWDRNPTEADRLHAVESLLAAFRRLPGVSDAGMTSALAFHPHEITARSALRVEGRVVDEADAPRVVTRVVSPGLLDVMGTPLRAGRAFDAGDHAGSPPVAIVNETLARRHFPGEDPVGRRVTVGVFGAPRTWEIVGVAGDVRASAFDAEPQPELFVPFAQRPLGYATFVVRTGGDPGALLPLLRDAVWSVDAGQSIYHLATLPDLVAATVAARRFHLTVAGALSAIAVALGLYGVLSLWANQRRREFGVRIALGARGADIARDVMRFGVRIALPGIVLGLAAAALVTRFITHLLYGVAPLDRATFLAVGAAILIVAALAAALPARRSVRADPLASIRAE